MLEPSSFPNGLIEGGEAQKFAIPGIQEIQFLFIDSKTTIKRHGHEDGQWEVWINLRTKIAYVCMPGLEHTLVNNSDRNELVLAIKGISDLSYGDFENLLAVFDVKAFVGDMIIT